VSLIPRPLLMGPKLTHGSLLDPCFAMKRNTWRPEARMARRTPGLTNGGARIVALRHQQGDCQYGYREHRALPPQKRDAKLAAQWPAKSFRPLPHRHAILAPLLFGAALVTSCTGAPAFKPEDNPSSGPVYGSPATESINCRGLRMVSVRMNRARTLLICHAPQTYAPARRQACGKLRRIYWRCWVRRRMRAAPSV
jgi:hypothetical protein